MARKLQLLMLVLSISACNPDEVIPSACETFNTSCTAPMGEGVQHNADVQRFFRVEVDQGGILDVTLDPVPASQRLQLDIYDASQNRINSTWASQSGQSIFYSQVARPERYYLSVRDTARSSDGQRYTLTAELDTSDPYEVNDTFAEAADIPVNEPIEAYLRPGNDKDFFRFEVPEAGVVQFTLDPVPSEPQLRMDIYNTQQNQVSRFFFAPTAGASLVAEQELAAGTNYVRITILYGYGVGSREPYTLTITTPVD